MKRISKLFLPFLALALVASCQEEEKPNLGVDEQWLQFGEQSYVVTENSTTPLIVEVFYAADTNPNGVTVNYSVVSENPDAYELSPSGGTINIPAGEFMAEIVITPLDNAETDGNKDIIITIDNEDIPVGLVGEGMFNDTTTVTITDDDCEFDIESFEGTYLADEEGYDEEYEVKVIYDEVNEYFIFSNLWDSGGSTAVRLDNSDPENPKVTYLGFDEGTVLASYASTGDGYAINYSRFNDYTEEDELSTFRTCDNYMNLYFFAYFPDISQRYNVHIELTKI